MAKFIKRAIRSLIGPRARCYKSWKKTFQDKEGLEIGGPSRVFSRTGIFPVYPIAPRIDNCNFAGETIWEDSVTEGLNYTYDARRPPGYQYIFEATDLREIPSDRYNFLLSSHTIEHIANPIRALNEWMRVLKAEGVMLLVVPHKDGTFDHRRPVTALDHMIEDFKWGIGEDDRTHLAEWLELTDLSRDPKAGTFDEFRKRSERFFENRSVHHHVFDTHLIAKLLDHVGFRICALEPIKPFHIVAVGHKTAVEAVPDNKAFLAAEAPYRRKSPFPSDRL